MEAALKFFLGTCLGRTLGIVAIMFVGMQITKGMAIRDAIMEKVAFFEISTAQAAVVEADRLRGIAEVVLADLQTATASDDALLTQLQNEIRIWETTNASADGCNVTADLLGLLRAN